MLGVDFLNGGIKTDGGVAIARRLGRIAVSCSYTYAEGAKGRLLVGHRLPRFEGWLKTPRYCEGNWR